MLWCKLEYEMSGIIHDFYSYAVHSDTLVCCRAWHCDAVQLSLCGVLQIMALRHSMKGCASSDACVSFSSLESLCEAEPVWMCELYGYIALNKVRRYFDGPIHCLCIG